MRPVSILATALLLTACASQSEPVDPPAEETPVQEPTQEAPATVGLEETHDFGDGLTITMVDLRREVDPDGFNASTGEEGELGYVAWRFEIANETGEAIPTGSTTSSCFVGDPLEETEQPVLGDSVNPPDVLQDGQTATWDADCWMEEDQAQLQYTIEFYDQDSASLYGPVTFAGEVPPIEEPAATQEQGGSQEDSQPEVPQQWVEEGFWECVEQNNFDDCYWKWSEVGGE